VESGCGYPPHRQDAQQESLRVLKNISKTTHKSFTKILADLPESIVRPAVNYPGIINILDIDSIEDLGLATAIKKYI
jgi:hypothetical protein